MIDYSTFLGSDGMRSEIRLSAATIAEFADATLDAHPEHRDLEAASALGLHDIVAPPTLAFVLTLGRSQPLPFPLDGFLHVQQSLRFSRPLVANDLLSATTRLVQARHRGGRGGPETWILTLEGNLTDPHGTLVAQSESRLLRRVGDGAGDHDSRGRGRTHGDEEDARGADDEALLWQTARTLRLTRENLRTYARVSGDPNPIHTDDSVARAYGLPGVIAHGMLSMALCAQVAEDEAKATRRALQFLACRFAAPVAPDEPLQIRRRADPASGSLALLLTGEAGDDVRVRGEARFAEPIA